MKRLRSRHLLGALARVVAGLLVIASVVPTVMALGLAVFVGVVAAQQPDPTVPDGDPCCGHPDSWGEVALGFGQATMLVLGAVAMIYITLRLDNYAASGRAPTTPQWRRIVGALGYIGIVLAILAGFP